MLSLVLVLTAQSMAIARGTDQGPFYRVVICSGGVSLAVYVDDTGAPVEPAHICPDCMLHLLGVLAGHDPAAQMPQRAVRVASGDAHPDVILRTPRTPTRVRGPPMSA